MYHLMKQRQSAGEVLLVGLKIKMQAELYISASVCGKVFEESLNEKPGGEHACERSGRPGEQADFSLPVILSGLIFFPTSMLFSEFKKNV